MQRIGRYEVVSELGHGGFGRVYAAFDPTVARAVAIKTLNGVGAPDLLARFRNEAATAGRLRHHNIVTIYDFGEHDGAPFLVMELLEGEDLQRVIHNRRELSVYGKLRILWEVADALKHAHANGIVHRDIKPANIMLLSDHRIKLLDFGIAWVAQTAMSRLTPQGNVIGTCRYMAPEQFRGESPDARADIFAYGIVCYELLTGAYPFHAADAAGIMYRILNDEPAPMKEHFVDCPAELDAILSHALEKDREARYQSLEDLQFDLAPTLLKLRKRHAESVLESAERRFAAGDAETAHAMIREALALDAGSAAARRLRDRIQHEIQRRAVRPKVEALIDLAQKRVVAREFDEAVRNLESALRLDSTNSGVRQKIRSVLAAREVHRRSERHADLAKRALGERNLTGALEYANEALIADPRNGAARQLLADIQAQRTRREQNRRVFELLGRVRSLLLARRFHEATELLMAADKELSETPEVREMLDRVREERVANEREIRLVSEISAARKMLREGEFDAAIGRLIGLQEEFPHTAEVRDLLEYARQQSQIPQTADTIDSPAVPGEWFFEGTGRGCPAPLRGSRWNGGKRAAALAMVLASTVAVGNLAVHSRPAHSRLVGAEPMPPPGAPSLALETEGRTAAAPLRKESGATDLPGQRIEKLSRNPMTALSAKSAANAPEPAGGGLQTKAAPGVLARFSPDSGAPRTPQVVTPLPPLPLGGIAPADPAPFVAEKVSSVTDPASLTASPAPPPDRVMRTAVEPSPATPLPPNSRESSPEVAGSLTAGSSPPNSNDQREILGAFQRFEQALANRSLEQVDAAWPGIPRSTRDSLRRAFREDNIRYTVRLTPVKFLSVDGNLATVDCERVAKTTVGGASRPDQITYVRATLKKVSNTWVIQGVQDLH